MKGAKIFGIVVLVCFILISICIGFMNNAGVLDNIKIDKKYNYDNAVQNAILSKYPNATFSFSNYREWESDGITFPEGAFTYTNSYNQKVTSTYMMKGCMGEIFYFRIDDIVMLNDADKFMELTEKYRNSQTE